jgi:energy-coupling factor transport system substrate-specific component
MTWQFASFGLLAAALLAGFAWYERSRPPARVLSLVASLAALAVVGRIAFAAIPNVKPTTDIVLFAGYALGPVPGFAVGAVTALVSNIFFTQGPWTPWQMAAWGGVGIGGGVLARLAGGRELGRLPLAIACGVAGLAFGVVLDTYQWTLAARQDTASFVAVSGTSLPYNLAHALGNVVFCLLIGPAFVRAMRRYRRRLEVVWRAPAAASLVLVAAAAGALASPPAADASASGRAARYLEGAQNRDGGFGPAHGRSSTQLHTGWTALGLAAAGRNPRDVERGGRSAIDYARSHARRLDDTGELERTILAVHAAGLSPRRFAGRDLRRELLGRRRGDGSFGRLVNLTAFGVLALRASGDPPDSRRVRRAARWLVRQQNGDGGFGFGRRGGASDVDDTGAVLQALAAARRDRSKAVRRALRYLRRARHADGGFGQMSRSPSNAQSTAWAVQGLVAVGRSTRTPLRYLRSLQAGDGSVRYSRSSAQTPVWVTAQALTALKQKPFPLGPVRRARRARAHAPTGARSHERSAPRAAVARRETPRPVPRRPGPRLAADPAAASARSEPQDGGSPLGAAIAAACAALVLGGLEWWKRSRRGAA